MNQRNDELMHYGVLGMKFGKKYVYMLMTK